jgi:carboxyl-terminal processing protease
MQRVFRPLAVFSIATGACLALGLQLLVSGAQGSDGPRYGSAGFFPGYDLAKLELVEPTLYHVDESYVDPTRIDWELMYTAALDAIERRVPVVMFSREPGGQIVAVEVGEYRTVLEVPTIRSRPELQDQLGRVAALLGEHLDPADIPMADDATTDPMAEIEYAAINGMLRTLDPHSILLPPDDAREMDVENQGEFGGLGITIEVDPVDGRLMISYPLQNTPAWTAGLKAEDHILRIDGESTINLSLDEAVNRLRGPVGDEVELEIARKDVPEPFAVTIKRELISIHPVQDELMEGGIGYVSIEGFHELVERDLDEALARLSREAGGELDGLILDLRGNPGGFLNQAVKVADTFLEAGEIVSTIDREGRRADREDARRDNEPTYPIVVLVDANSASASEIVAGALRYNERAVIIGERTFGKGSVQNLHPFYDDSKLKLTISKYLTAGDRSLQAIGIPADIELDPAIVPPVSSDEPIRLFYRENNRREADLDRSFERVALQIDDPAYRIRYVQPERPKRRSDGPDLNDPQVVLARDVLKAAPGWRRSDVLIAAAPVVGRYQRAGNDQLVRGLAEHGIDWSNGAAAPRSGALPLEVSLDLGPDGKLVAGSDETVAVTVKNTSTQPLYRVAAVVDGEGLLGSREFLFGAVPPGASRRFEHEVEVPEGWPAERAPVTFLFRDSGDGELGTWTTDLPIEPHPLPSFAWRWSVTDGGGDGDGVLDLNEPLEVKVEITNVGTGPSTDPFARLRNRSRTAIDLLDGTLTPGVPIARDGSSCPPDEYERLPDGCRFVLAAGERWSGSFSFVAKSAPPDGAPLEVELSLGDGSAYDQAAVVRSSFYDYFGEKEQIALTPGMPLPSSEQHRAPSIEVTRAPPGRVDSGRSTVSGVVTDDRGLNHVMVFVGDDKVFFEGGGTLRTVPFTADVSLEPGSNVVTVLATDVQGFKSSRSVVIWNDAAEVAKASATPSR